MSPISLKIAILDCDTPVPNVHSKFGKYSDIFVALLKDASVLTDGLPELDLNFSIYDSVLGRVPSDKDLKNIDGIIMTGSSASGYDEAPWIITLSDYIRNLYTNHPSIKIFGSCFGHQMLCGALFSTPTHPVVTKDPAGWELGVHSIKLSSAFLSQYGPVTSNPITTSELRLQFVHADHVVHPITHEMWVKEGWESIGRSAHCGLQGVWKKGRVLTYQGHAEFSRFVNAETLKVFGGRIWTSEFMENALAKVDQDDDAMWAAGVMLKFFLEE
ncbi:class I glutamine amidotransferase-like protein [Calycina marina]|uniref:Class I glutamine amidotransferase-like protein n=1 Tax=Calycina marina TaxID=1763456 RepID=A0A9P7Z0R2_9HELO|nr:class I glutamine amidotransferase-like protein [Calycina marina]